MNYLSARSRIAFGQACLLASVLLLAIVLGVLPDRTQSVLRGRAQLCEAIAVNSSILVSRKDIRRLEAILKTIVARNDQLLSAAVRKRAGELVVKVGEHERHWQEISGENSIHSNIQVAIRAGEQKWGRVEFCFAPIHAAGMFTWLTNPWIRSVLFITALNLLVSYYYLGKMLQHLDPSKAVPGRVRSALDTLAEGLLVVDTKGRIVLANEALANSLGKSAEKLMGHQAAALGWIDGDGTPTRGPFPWQDALQLETPQLGITMGLVNASGKRSTFMVNCTPVMGADGQCRGVLTSFDDVTQLEETKVKLEHSRQAAEQANQSKSEFLARMSHEIRTPMNAILGFTDVLRRGFDKDVSQRQDYLNTIHSSGQHLLSLINDILDLSKVEAGKLALESKACSPLRIIAEVTAIMRARADEQGNQLGFDTEGLVPETIVTDPTRLRQIVTNLVGNAIKFTQQGSVRVSARVCKSQGDSALAISVADTGIGMTAEMLEVIFNPFVQADTSITRKFGGTGLGLSICKRIAEALGGNLTVTSQPGKGSVFTATIQTGPLAGVPMISAADVPSPGQHTPAAQEVLRLPASRILVADDGVANRKLIALVLSRAGVQVDTAEDGQVALEKVAQARYDLILMDMQMPRIDGYTATSRLRELGFTAPIIALTADAMKGSEEKCRTAGCTGFLTKPIDMDALLRALASELQGLAAETNEKSLPGRQPAESWEVEQTGSTEYARLPQGLDSGKPTVAISPVESFQGDAGQTQPAREISPRDGQLDQIEQTLAELKQQSAQIHGDASAWPHPNNQSKPSTRDISTRPTASIQPVPSAADQPATGGPARADTNEADRPLYSALPAEDPEFQAIVSGWAAKLQEKLQQMRVATDRQDFQAVAQLAHWLKGSAGTVGFNAFTDPAKTLERQAKQGDQRQMTASLAILEDLGRRIVLPTIQSAAPL